MSRPKNEGLAAPAAHAEVTREPTRPPQQAAAQQAPPRRGWMREAAVLAGLVAVGVAVTWPRTAYLAGSLPRNPDQAQYVWSLWWVAHQITHGGSPWSTSYLAAPVGIQMGFDT